MLTVSVVVEIRSHSVETSSLSVVARAVRTGRLVQRVHRILSVLQYQLGLFLRHKDEGMCLDSRTQDQAQRSTYFAFSSLTPMQKCEPSLSSQVGLCILVYVSGSWAFEHAQLTDLVGTDTDALTPNSAACCSFELPIGTAECYSGTSLMPQRRCKSHQIRPKWMPEAASA